MTLLVFSRTKFVHESPDTLFGGDDIMTHLFHSIPSRLSVVQPLLLKFFSQKVVLSVNLFIKSSYILFFKRKPLVNENFCTQDRHTLLSASVGASVYKYMATQCPAASYPRYNSISTAVLIAPTRYTSRLYEYTSFSLCPHTPPHTRRLRHPKLTLPLPPPHTQGTGFLVSAQAEATEGEGEETLTAELESAEEAVKEAAVEGLRIVEDDESSGDDEDEPTPGAKVEILTDENFERLTQVSTGATTGDWFVGEMCFCVCVCVSPTFAGRR